MTGDLSIRQIFRNSFRVYFAPITGAIKGIRVEMRRADPKNPAHLLAHTSLTNQRHGANPPKRFR